MQPAIWVLLAVCALMLVAVLAGVISAVGGVALAVGDPKGGWAAFKQWVLGGFLRRRGEPDGSAPRDERHQPTDSGGHGAGS